MTLLDELRWLRANYAAGSTAEINSRLDLLINTETDPDFIRLSDALELLMMADRGYMTVNSRANGIVVIDGPQLHTLEIIEFDGVRYVNRISVDFLVSYRP